MSQVEDDPILALVAVRAELDVLRAFSWQTLDELKQVTAKHEQLRTAAQMVAAVWLVSPDHVCHDERLARAIFALQEAAG